MEKERLLQPPEIEETSAEQDVKKYDIAKEDLNNQVKISFIDVNYSVTIEATKQEIKRGA